MTLRSMARMALSAFPTADALFRRSIWSRQHFPEAEMLFLHRLPAGSFDVAIDVGAALGAYSWILNRKARRVLAFEPGKVHADFLARGLAGTRIELIRAAVGASAGTVQMFTPGDDTTAHHSATLSADNPVASVDGVRVTQIPQVRLDEHLAACMEPNERVDFVKVDVEGYEGAVFEGAQAMIARDHPLIMCEIEARHNAQCAEVFELLNGLGYQPYFFRDGRFEHFDGTDLAPLQQEDDLAYRLSDGFTPEKNKYINNFTFEHPESKVKVSR